MIGSILSRARTFFRSLAGQIFLLLTIGMSLAAMVALLVAEQSRSHDFQRWRIQRVVASAEDIGHRLQRDPQRVEAMLAAQQIMGAAAAPEGIAVAEPDAALASALRARFGPASNPEASQVPTGLCFPALHYDPSERAAGVIDAPRPDCWIVRFTEYRSPPVDGAQSAAFGEAPQHGGKPALHAADRDRLCWSGDHRGPHRGGAAAPSGACCRSLLRLP
jgi:hypothetical protein